MDSRNFFRGDRFFDAARNDPWWTPGLGPGAPRGASPGRMWWDVLASLVMWALVLIALACVVSCSRGAVPPSFRAPPGFIEPEDPAPSGMEGPGARAGVDPGAAPGGGPWYSPAAEAARVASARAEARGDLARTVKRVTGWSMGALALFGVGQVALSFLFPWASVRAGVLSLCGVAGVSLARYALLAWGSLLADAAVWICVAGLALAAAFVAVPMAVAWVRAKVRAQGIRLASELRDPGPVKEITTKDALAREATALLAAGDRRVDAVRKKMPDALIGAILWPKDAGQPSQGVYQNELARLGLSIPGATFLREKFLRELEPLRPTPKGRRPVPTPAPPPKAGDGGTKGGGQ